MNWACAQLITPPLILLTCLNETALFVSFTLLFGIDEKTGWNHRNHNHQHKLKLMETYCLA